MITVGIVDYGCGNLFSLKSSLDRLGVAVKICSSPRDLSSCSRLILPGVGAFGDAAKKLVGSGMAAELVRLAETTPLLGVCLGMQMLFERSTEYGEHRGLGLLRGDVLPLENDVVGLKIPHMGWNSLDLTRNSRLLKYIDAGEYVYFVHSYHAKNCADSVVATTDYGCAVTAAVERENVFGTQFHPEKSGDTGLRILKAFTEL